MPQKLFYSLWATSTASVLSLSCRSKNSNMSSHVHTLQRKKLTIMLQAHYYYCYYYYYYSSYYYYYYYYFIIIIIIIIIIIYIIILIIIIIIVAVVFVLIIIHTTDRLGRQRMRLTVLPLGCVMAGSSTFHSVYWVVQTPLLTYDE